MALRAELVDGNQVAGEHPHVDEHRVLHPHEQGKKLAQQTLANALSDDDQHRKSHFVFGLLQHVSNKLLEKFDGNCVTIKDV